jgi:hypothetical protein
MNLVKINSSALNSIGQRMMKFLRYGAKDVQTAIEGGPHGMDSRAVENSIAIYAKLDEETVVIGYLLRDKLAEVGETRLYSTNTDGELKAYVWLKNDGIMHLSGDNDFAVSFNNLKTEFNALKADHNTLADKWNTFCAAYLPGSPSTLGTPPTLATSTVMPNASDIDNAKNTKIKTIAP